MGYIKCHILHPSCQNLLECSVHWNQMTSSLGFSLPASFPSNHRATSTKQWLWIPTFSFSNVPHTPHAVAFFSLGIRTRERGTGQGFSLTYLTPLICKKETAAQNWSDTMLMTEYSDIDRAFLSRISNHVIVSCMSEFVCNLKCAVQYLLYNPQAISSSHWSWGPHPLT